MGGGRSKEEGGGGGMRRAKGGGGRRRAEGGGGRGREENGENQIHLFGIATNVAWYSYIVFVGRGAT